jgi:hypothetical protein
MTPSGDGHLSGGGGDEQVDHGDRAGAVRTTGRARPGWGHGVVDVVERVVDVAGTTGNDVAPVALRGVAAARPVALAAAR